jgi:hypothetical protein
MRRPIITFVLGLLVGLAASAGASRDVTPAEAMAQIAGSGYLFGWTITIGGEEICSDPYVWNATKEIDCD